jgi:prepilin-type N-terminal cleavage/methylation domain-containing protein
MRARGFTLIECVVAVVILSVLASLASNAYVLQKRRAEYNGMRANVQTLSAAVKNRFYTTDNVVSTYSFGFGTTAGTNNAYGTNLCDGTFSQYLVRTTTAPFEMIVKYRLASGGCGWGASTGTYTFNANATQTACSGADCMWP